MTKIDAETACLTWIRTGDLDQAVRVFGGHPLVSEPETLDGLFGIAPEDLPDDATGVALVARHGEWAVLIEPFAFRGLSQTLLCEAAAEGEAYRVAWTVNRSTFVSYVRDGEVVASFDAQDLEGAHGRDWIDALPVSAADWDADWMAAAFAVAGHLSGIVIDADWLAASHSLHWLRPMTVRRAPALRIDARMRSIAETDPRIAQIIAEPTPARLPEIVLIAATMAVATAGLDGPAVEEALALITDRGHSAEVATRLRALQDDCTARMWEAYESWPEESREDSPYPGHDTTYGRWRIKATAAEILILALTPAQDLADQALEITNTTGGTYLSQENGDIARHHALGSVAYFLATGENA
ncbi:hypothetical protein [Herbidospora cretacea]|uniref:hypothetical protein n=1 Tax=Herbidospora cretacea TaxID=28444 RepID=UPI000774C0ED|nr:hypothetical protein [Herbidospora cretacea]